MNKYSRRFFLTAMMMSVTVACGNNSNNSSVSSKDKLDSAKIPSRIVALGWVYIEDLLALGIQPIGVADIEGYQKFVNIEPQLAESVVDVGDASRTEFRGDRSTRTRFDYRCRIAASRNL